MMQKEEKIVVVLLVVAVLSLIIAYFGFAPQTNAYSSDSKIDERVYAEGTILSKQMTGKGDNLILSLSNLNVKVFIAKNNGAKEVYDSMRTGDSVRITGKVSIYRDERELVVESPKDN
ncbi:MAG: OB-fold nucleic acid binding domain-containing protein [Candidatus Methanoperedens sp.]|nr:OB-fold nucleic acid binding domain-containing protein [Candidatus Methanoperedens sp.]